MKKSYKVHVATHNNHENAITEMHLLYNKITGNNEYFCIKNEPDQSVKVFDIELSELKEKLKTNKEVRMFVEELNII